MNFKIFSFALFSLALFSSGMTAPEGGTLISPVDLVQTSLRHCDKRIVDSRIVKVEGQSFKEAFQFDIKETPDQPWSAQAVWKITKPVEKGDILWLRFFARTLKNENESGEGIIRAIFQRGSGSYLKSLSHDVNLSAEW